MAVETRSFGPLSWADYERLQRLLPEEGEDTVALDTPGEVELLRLLPHLMLSRDCSTLRLWEYERLPGEAACLCVFKGPGEPEEWLCAVACRGGHLVVQPLGAGGSSAPPSSLARPLILESFEPDHSHFLGIYATPSAPQLLESMDLHVVVRGALPAQLGSDGHGTSVALVYTATVDRGLDGKLRVYPQGLGYQAPTITRVLHPRRGALGAAPAQGPITGSPERELLRELGWVSSQTTGRVWAAATLIGDRLVTGSEWSSDRGNDTWWARSLASATQGSGSDTLWWVVAVGPAQRLLWATGKGPPPQAPHPHKGERQLEQPLAVGLVPTTEQSGPDPIMALEGRTLIRSRWLEAVETTGGSSGGHSAGSPLQRMWERAVNALDQAWGGSLSTWCDKVREVIATEEPTDQGPVSVRTPRIDALLRALLTRAKREDTPSEADLDRIGALFQKGSGLTRLTPLSRDVAALAHDARRMQLFKVVYNNTLWRVQEQVDWLLSEELKRERTGTSTTSGHSTLEDRLKGHGLFGRIQRTRFSYLDPQPEADSPNMNTLVVGDFVCEHFLPEATSRLRVDPVGRVRADNGESLRPLYRQLLALRKEEGTYELWLAHQRGLSGYELTLPPGKSPGVSPIQDPPPLPDVPTRLLRRLRGPPGDVAVCVTNQGLLLLGPGAGSGQVFPIDAPEGPLSALATANHPKLGHYLLMAHVVGSIHHVRVYERTPQARPTGPAFTLRKRGHPLALRRLGPMDAVPVGPRRLLLCAGHAESGLLVCQLLPLIGEGGRPTELRLPTRVSFLRLIFVEAPWLLVGCADGILYAFQVDVSSSSPSLTLKWTHQRKGSVVSMDVRAEPTGLSRWWVAACFGRGDVVVLDDAGRALWKGTLPDSGTGVAFLPAVEEAQDQRLAILDSDGQLRILRCRPEGLQRRRLLDPLPSDPSLHPEIPARHQALKDLLTDAAPDQLLKGARTSRSVRAAIMTFVAHHLGLFEAQARAICDGGTARDLAILARHALAGAGNTDRRSGWPMEGDALGVVTGDVSAAHHTVWSGRWRARLLQIANTSGAEGLRAKGDNSADAITAAAVAWLGGCWGRSANLSEGEEFISALPEVLRRHPWLQIEALRWFGQRLFRPLGLLPKLALFPPSVLLRAGVVARPEVAHLYLLAHETLHLGEGVHLDALLARMGQGLLDHGDSPLERALGSLLRLADPTCGWGELLEAFRASTHLRQRGGEGDAGSPLSQLSLMLALVSANEGALPAPESTLVDRRRWIRAVLGELQPWSLRRVAPWDEGWCRRLAPVGNHLLGRVREILLRHLEESRSLARAELRLGVSDEGNSLRLVGTVSLGSVPSDTTVRGVLLEGVGMRLVSSGQPPLLRVEESRVQHLVRFGGDYTFVWRLDPATLGRDATVKVTTTWDAGGGARPWSEDWPLPVGPLRRGGSRRLSLEEDVPSALAWLISQVEEALPHKRLVLVALDDAFDPRLVARRLRRALPTLGAPWECGSSPGGRSGDEGSEALVDRLTSQGMSGSGHLVLIDGRCWQSWQERGHHEELAAGLREVEPPQGSAVLLMPRSAATWLGLRLQRARVVTFSGRSADHPWIQEIGAWATGWGATSQGKRLRSWIELAGGDPHLVEAVFAAAPADLDRGPHLTPGLERLLKELFDQLPLRSALCLVLSCYSTAPLPGRPSERVEGLSPSLPSNEVEAAGLRRVLGLLERWQGHRRSLARLVAVGLGRGHGEGRDQIFVPWPLMARWVRERLRASPTGLATLLTPKRVLEEVPLMLLSTSQEWLGALIEHPSRELHDLASRVGRVWAALESRSVPPEHDTRALSQHLATGARTAAPLALPEGPWRCYRVEAPPPHPTLHLLWCHGEQATEATPVDRVSPLPRPEDRAGLWIQLGPEGGPGVEGLVHGEPLLRALLIAASNRRQLPALWTQLDVKARLKTSNPFSSAGALPPGSAVFVGRTRELDFIVPQEGGPGGRRAPNVLVVGPRRMGKTSLMKQVVHRLAGLRRPWIWLGASALSTRRELLPELYHEARRLALEPGPDEGAEPLLKRLIAAHPGLTVLIDEADALIHGDPDFLWRMRDLSASGGVSFVFSAFRRGAEALRDEASALWQWTQGMDAQGRTISLSELAASELSELVRLLEEPPLDLRWEDEEQRRLGVQKLMEASQGVPWRLQHLLSELVDWLAERGRSELRLADVEVVLRRAPPLGLNDLYGGELTELMGAPGDRVLAIACELGLLTTCLALYPEMAEVGWGGREPAGDASARPFDVELLRHHLKSGADGLGGAGTWRVVGPVLEGVDWPRLLWRLSFTLALAPSPHRTDHYHFRRHLLPRRFFEDANGHPEEKARRLFEALLDLPTWSPHREGTHNE